MEVSPPPPPPSYLSVFVVASGQIRGVEARSYLLRKASPLTHCKREFPTHSPQSLCSLDSTLWCVIHCLSIRIWPPIVPSVCRLETRISRAFFSYPRVFVGLAMRATRRLSAIQGRSLMPLIIGSKTVLALQRAVSLSPFVREKKRAR